MSATEESNNKKPQEKQAKTLEAWLEHYLPLLLISIVVFTILAGAISLLLIPPPIITAFILILGIVFGLSVGIETALIIDALNRDLDAKNQAEQKDLMLAILLLSMGLGISAGLMLKYLFMPSLFAFAGTIGSPILISVLGLIAGLAVIALIFTLANLLGSRHAFAKLALVQPFTALDELFGITQLEKAHKVAAEVNLENSDANTNKTDPTETIDVTPAAITAPIKQLSALSSSTNKQSTQPIIEIRKDSEESKTITETTIKTDSPSATISTEPTVTSPQLPLTTTPVPVTPIPTSSTGMIKEILNTQPKAKQKSITPTAETTDPTTPSKDSIYSAPTSAQCGSSPNKPIESKGLGAGDSELNKFIPRSQKTTDFLSPLVQASPMKGKSPESNFFTLLTDKIKTLANTSKDEKDDVNVKLKALVIACNTVTQPNYSLSSPSPSLTTLINGFNTLKAAFKDYQTEYAKKNPASSQQLAAISQSIERYTLALITQACIQYQNQSSHQGLEILIKNASPEVLEQASQKKPFQTLRIFLKNPALQIK